MTISDSAAIALPAAFFGTGAPISVTAVSCGGQEATLTECSYNRNRFCFPTRVVSVLCQCELHKKTYMVFISIPWCSCVHYIH